MPLAPGNRLPMLLLSLLLTTTSLATPGAGFPHGAESRSEPTTLEERPCHVAFSSWVRHQSAPTPHPERAANWHFGAQLGQRLLALENARPHMVETRCIGRSVQGRPIWATTITPRTQPIRHRVLVFAQLHALEWIGSEVAVSLAERLVAHPPEGVEVVLVPVANPDGRFRVESDLVDDRVEVYRRANSNGVDLNRDWSLHRESNVIWSRLPFFNKYYHSSGAPLSQPETRALDALAATGFDASFSLHAFGGVIYIPWAGTSEPIEREAEHLAMARAMSQAMPGRGYRVVQLSRYFRWFRGLGMEIDHMHGVHGTRSFLLELTRSGLQPLQPSTWKDTFRWYNPVDPSPHVRDGVAALYKAIQLYAHSDRVLGAVPPVPQVRPFLPTPTSNRAQKP